jgi:hypothetical protein
LRQAIETIIYLYEVKGIKDNAELAIHYMDPQAYASDLFTERKKIVETAKNERILTRVVPETGQVAQQELPPPDLTRFAVKMAPDRARPLSLHLPLYGHIFTRNLRRNRL